MGNDNKSYILQGNDNYATYTETVNLFYPNPLYGNDTFKPYAWYQNYEGSELFKFFSPGEYNTIFLRYYDFTQIN